MHVFLFIVHVMAMTMIVTAVLQMAMTVQLVVMRVHGQRGHRWRLHRMLPERCVCPSWHHGTE